MQTPPPNLYEFGDFQLDAAKRRLRRLDGTPIPLTPRVFKTLLYMVEHHDGVLDKERIMEAVWPDSIVEENNLAQAISKMGQVFGEAPGSDNYIVTVPGRGYRFVAEVSQRAADKISRTIEEHTTIPASLHKPSEASTETDQEPARAQGRWISAAAVGSAIVLVGLVALFFVRYRSLPAIVRGPRSPAPADAVL